ncbi:unnamed protein product, partial [Didymodactylos carnosus]
MPKTPRRKKLSQKAGNLEGRRLNESFHSENLESSSSEDETVIINPDDDTDRIDFKSPTILNDLTDLYTFCQSQLNTRFLTTLLSTSLRYLGHSWRETDAFLKEIDGMTCRTAHKWANILVNGDFDECTKDERGGKRGDSFWDCYPDLELEAKQFTLEECSKKEASFMA